MKKHLLLVFFIATVFPVVAALSIAAAGLFHHEKAMERVARSYAEDLVENIAYRLERESFLGRRFSLGMFSSRQLGIFSWGPSIPGWIAVVSSDGTILFSSPGAESLKYLWSPDMPVGRAAEVYDPEGKKYTIAVYPSSDGDIFVVGAVAWEKLLGPMIRFNHLWIFLVIIVFVAALSSFLPLWYWVVIPLKKVVSEISSLKWGSERPVRDDIRAVNEIRSLRQVLYDLSNTSIERNELRSRYINDIVKVQEEEKARIAREIHDGPLQTITALIQQIRLFKRKVDLSDNRSSEHLDIAEEAARNTVRELRGLCDELSPPWIDLGIEHALTELANRLSRYFNINVNVDVEDDLVLSRESIVTLFRVFQEGVNNASRHGKASNVNGSVFSDNGDIKMEIVDDGEGFEPEADLEKLRLKGHRGLANMMERLHLLGGQLHVESFPGRGTRLTCSIPFNKRSQDE